METWYAYEMEGERVVVDCNEYDLWPFFRRVAEELAMEDCSGAQVTDIVCEGWRFRYVGWQPGMKFEFVNVDDPEDVYIIWCPELDH